MSYALGIGKVVPDPPEKFPTLKTPKTDQVCQTKIKQLKGKVSSLKTKLEEKDDLKTVALGV